LRQSIFFFNMTNRWSLSGTRLRLENKVIVISVVIMLNIGVGIMILMIANNM
jgi:hypothetical protein